MDEPRRVHLLSSTADMSFRVEQVRAGYPGSEVWVREAELDRLREALTEIAEITERKESKYPSDWREQIEACPECRRYKDHPIQRGICDNHRRPIYAQEDYDRHETYILGYRAKRIAQDALHEHRRALAALDGEDGE